VATHSSEANLSEESIAKALSGDTQKLEMRGRSGVDTWNTFEVRGEEKIVSLLAPPVMYGRFPNYRSRDLTIQSADAVIAVMSPHKSDIDALATLEMVRKSLKGSFQKRYRARSRHPDPSFGNAVFPAPEQPRPVYIVLSESSKDFTTKIRAYRGWRKEEPEKTFEQALEKLRQECATFMKEFGDAHGVKLFTLPDTCEVTDLASFVVRACEDIDDNQGVTFKIKEIPPLASPTKPVVLKSQSVSSPVSVPTTTFPTLDKVNKNEQSADSNTISWNGFSALF